MGILRRQERQGQPFEVTGTGSRTSAAPGARAGHGRWHIALIALLGLAGYGQLLVPGNTLYSPHSDFIAHTNAAKEVLRRSVAAGHGLPGWRSDQLSGFAALSNPNALYTYPLHAPFVFLAPERSVGPVVWLHFVLSGLAFYALGAALELGAFARLVMGVAGLFNLKLILAIYAGFIFMPSAALLPGLFAALLRVLRLPDRRGWLAFMMMLYLCLHGHPQIAIYAGAVFGVWAVVWAGVLAARNRSTAAGKRLVVLASASLVALGLVAHFVLPLASETPLVTRGERSYEAFLAGHTVGARHLVTLLSLDALGSPLDHSYPTDELWEDAMSFGAVALAFACCALWLRTRQPVVIGCSASLAFVLFLACDTPLLRLAFEHVPGIHYLRHPGRILFLAPVFGIALAGIGFDALLARVRTPRRAAALVATVLLLIGVEGVVHARRYVTTKPIREAFPAPDYARALMRDSGVFRVAPVGRATLNYGWAARWGVQLVTGYDHINYRHYQVFMDVLRQGAVGPARAVGFHDLASVARFDLLDALNVKYVVSQYPLRAPPGRLRERGRWARVPAFFFFYGLRDRAVVLYENLGAKARAFFPDSARHVDDRTELSALMETDLTRVALVADASIADGSRVGFAGDARVDAIRSRDGALDFVTRASGRRFLVISEVWHPGWRARLDGRPLLLVRADIALMGAWIPAGRHRIELDFETPGWPLGVGISASSAAVALLVAFSIARRR